MSYLFYFHVIYSENFNFNKNYLRLQAEFNFSDSYFIYQDFPILLSRLPPNWLDDYKNWESIGVKKILKLYAIKRSNFYFQYLEKNKYQNREIYLNVFNNYSNSIIYNSAAGETRAPDNNYYSIFSVGKQCISFINETVPGDVFSDPRICSVSPAEDPTIVIRKQSPDGKALFPDLTINNNTYLINSNVSFDQIIIYPLGPITEIVLTDSTSSMDYIVNTETVILNSNVKYFLIKLIRQCVHKDFTQFKRIRISPPTTKIDIFYTASTPVSGVVNLNYGYEYFEPYVILDTSEVYEMEFQNNKYWAYPFKLNGSSYYYTTSQYKDFNNSDNKIYGIFDNILQLIVPAQTQSDSFMVSQDCYILWDHKPNKDLRIPYDFTSINMLCKGVNKLEINPCTNNPDINDFTGNICNANICNYKGDDGEFLNLQKGVNFTVIYDKSLIPRNYYLPKIPGESYTNDISTKNSLDLLSKNLTVFPLLLGDEPLINGMRYYADNFDYKRYYQMKNLIRKIIIIPLNLENIKYDEHEMLYTNDIEYQINLPLVGYNVCTLHIMSCDYKRGKRDIVMFSNCARRIRNKLVPLYITNINNCLNRWYYIDNIKKFKIYFLGDTSQLPKNFNIFLYLS